jgi:hypothetical protein
MKENLTVREQNNHDLMNLIRNDYIVLIKPKHENGNNNNLNSKKSAKQIISQLLGEITLLNLINEDTSSDLKFMINDYLDNSTVYDEFILDDDNEDFEDIYY